MMAGSTNTERATPKVVIFVAIAAGVATLHQCGVLAITIVRGETRFWWIPAIYVAWGGVLIFGTLRRSRLAWKLGSAFALIVGAISVGCTIIALIGCLSDASFFLPHVHRCLFCAVYLLTTYYLLRRPASVVYFRNCSPGVRKGDSRQIQDG
jgi:hypothetical protein